MLVLFGIFAGTAAMHAILPGILFWPAFLVFQAYIWTKILFKFLGLGVDLTKLAIKVRNGGNESSWEAYKNDHLS